MHCVTDCIGDSVFHAIRPDGDSGTNQSLRSEKNMRSDMVPVDSARPAVESISNGPAFELKRIAESVVERRYRGLQSRSTNRRRRFVEMQLVRSCERLPTCRVRSLLSVQCRGLHL